MYLIQVIYFKTSQQTNFYFNTIQGTKGPGHILYILVNLTHFFQMFYNVFNILNAFQDNIKRFLYCYFFLFTWL